MLKSKPFSPAEAVRQQVLTAMEASPSRGRQQYGILFHGDFAQDPTRYGLIAPELRAIQARTLITCALHDWSTLDVDYESVLPKAVEAAKFSYLMRHDSSQPAFYLTDDDLISQKIKPEMFDKLSWVLNLRAIDALQKQDAAAGLSADQKKLLQDIRVLMNFPADAPVDYKAQVKAMGYSTSSDKSLYFKPIMDITGDMREADKTGYLSDIGFVRQLRDHFPGLYNKVKQVDLSKTLGDTFTAQNASATPAADHCYIKPPVAVDYQKNNTARTVTRGVIDAIFDMKPYEGSVNAQKLHDHLLTSQIPVEGVGFTEGDFRKIDALFMLSTQLGLYRDLSASDDLAYLAQGWMYVQAKTPVFSDEVMDELGIARNFGKIFVETVAVSQLQKMAGQDKHDESEKMLMQAFFQPAACVLDNQTFLHVSIDKGTYAANKQKLAAFDFDGWYRQHKLNPADPVATIYKYFEDLPGKDAPVKDWFPDMHARICRKNNAEAEARASREPGRPQDLKYQG